MFREGLKMMVCPPPPAPRALEVFARFFVARAKNFRAFF